MRWVAVRGAILKPLLSNFEPLIKLVSKYNYNFEHSKTIPLVHNALEGHRLHIFKSSSKESDLRVALRAFYEDKNRDDKSAVIAILNFVFDQLKKEVKQSGYISQPRHAWWAVLTILSEADSSWLNKNKSFINKIIKHLISVIEYSPRVDRDFTSIVPELDSVFNEKTWVTINAIRLYKKNISKYISRNTMQMLKAKI